MRRETSPNRYAATLLLILATLTTKKINAQFDIEDSNTTANLRGIHNVGGGVAWASGTNGTVLRSEDGGYLWQTCNIPPGAEKLDFRGIQAFDENTAIVMSSGPGDQSRLYKTTDGCQTWKLLFTNPDKDGFWDALCFELASRFDRNLIKQGRGIGTLMGDPVEGKFVIYTTRDSGDTWQAWSPYDPAFPKIPRHPATARDGETIFAASNSSGTIVNNAPAFVTGGTGGSRLFLGKHHDPLDWGGWEWIAFSPHKLPIHSDSTSGAFSVAARRSINQPFEDLMIVGGDYKYPQSPGIAAFFSTGLDLKRAGISTTPPRGYRSSVAYDPTQKLWITVGPNGTDISTDDGKNWTPLKPSGYDPPDADKNWNALSLPFVVGPHGRIGKLRTITQK